MNDLVQQWHINEPTLLLVEKHCYQNIAGPSKIAPRGKRPLSVPSEMTAHHWLNFTKVYGEYLIVNMYAAHDPMNVVAPVAAIRTLRIVKLATKSFHTEASSTRLKELIRVHAESWNRLWPEHEKSQVHHMLMFHIPATIDFWGPARYYWCFPFERSVLTFSLINTDSVRILIFALRVIIVSRNIQKLSRSVKSRQKPALNLINTNRTYSCLKRTFRHAKDFDEVDEAEEDESKDDHTIVHPLVSLIPPHAVNSTTNRVVQSVRFPTMTKNNSKFIHNTVAKSNLSGRFFTPILGPRIVKHNHGNSNSFEMRGTYSTIYIGPWKFQTMEEKHSFTPGTSHAYFCMRARWIAQEYGAYYSKLEDQVLKDLGYDQDELVYGRFHRFVKMSLHNWTAPGGLDWSEEGEAGQVYMLGECTLWRPIRRQPHSALAIFDWDDPIICLDENGDQRLNPNRTPMKVSWIPLKHVETIVAIAPVVTGWDDKDNIEVSTTEFVAMPIRI